MANLSSYPKILALGHRAIKDIFEGAIVCEEKVDGSQFSFGIIDGKLQCRSKGQQIILDACDKMFTLGVELAQRLEPSLTPGWTYRGEFLNRPKHNTLAYERAPNNSFILFDVETGPSCFLNRKDKEAEAQRLGLEVVPCYFEGELTSENIGGLQSHLANLSILGGQKIEGIVIKNYAKFTPDGKVAMAKIVSEEFKEIHQGEWRKSNPAPVDIVTGLIAGLATPARFNKAVQQLRDAGTLQEAPQDIGPLIKAVQSDVKEECIDTIKEALFDYAWPQIARGLAKGIPDWYKQKLLESGLNNVPAAHEYRDLGEPDGALPPSE